MSTVSIAALQFKCTSDRGENVSTAERMVRRAANAGAQVLVLPELFETPYFCAVQSHEFLNLASPLSSHPAVEHFRPIVKSLGIVLVLSVFELAGTVRFNTVVVLDADGSTVGSYRKSHIPQATGYEEKYYFATGDTGFHPIKTSYGDLGVGICWDQWFPEVARALVLRGAQFLVYPTAIGSDVKSPEVDSMEHWRIVMRGHAGANMLPVIAANRIGKEQVGGVGIQFFGSSFMADHVGNLTASADRDSEAVLLHAFDLSASAAYRDWWGCFRDRRPDLYGGLMTLDGARRSPGSV